MNPLFKRSINPYLAVLIITIFGSVMTTVITHVADTVSAVEEDVTLLAPYLN